MHACCCCSLEAGTPSGVSVGRSSPSPHSLGKNADERLRTSRIPAGHVSQFRLPIDLQPHVIQAAVEWMDETLPKPHRHGRAFVDAETNDGGIAR